MITLLVVSLVVSLVVLAIAGAISLDTVTRLGKEASDTWWWDRGDRDEWDRAIANKTKVRVRVVGAAAVVEVSLPWSPWFYVRRGMSEEAAIEVATQIVKNLRAFANERAEEKIIIVTPDGDEK